MKAFTDWIEQHYPTREAALGKCAEATSDMVEAFPSLKRIRGGYWCPIWGWRDHWWLVTPEGDIIDPAAEYVPAIGEAFALIDKHFGDAISQHHRGATQ